MINESIDVLNKRLVDHFSVAWNGMPIWRIVYSEEQFEKRLTYYTDSGIQLLHPEYRELPKYRQWIHNKYVLERLTAVPAINADELTEKITYEPIFVFEDGKGNPLPPHWGAAKFVIDSMLAAMGEESMYPKYVDPDNNDYAERQEEKINQLTEELFGNETDVTDALTYKQGIVVPPNYKEKN